MRAAPLALLLAASEAGAHSFGDELEVYAYAQTWLTLVEQLEEADEVYQFPSGDRGVTATTGWSLHRLRAGIEYFFVPGRLGLNLLLKLERNPAVLNAFATFRVADWLRIRVGQQKIPTTWEGLVLSRDLDFMRRSLLARASADYALSRTVHPSSLFFNNRSFLRDLGVAVRGDIDLELGGLRYFAMVGNGLGANLYIGGASEAQFILTNAPQFFYGLRLELFDLLDTVTAGGHVSVNRHDDMVFGSGRVVYDLDRLSWSADLRVHLRALGLRLAATHGRGRVDDDFDDDGNVDFRFQGWEVRLLWSLSEAFATLLPEEHNLELGARYDWLRSRWNGAGSRVRRREVTAGVNYAYRSYVRVMLDGVFRRTRDPGLPDLDDDGLLLSLQVAI